MGSLRVSRPQEMQLELKDLRMFDKHPVVETASPPLPPVEVLQASTVAQNLTPRKLLIEFTGSGSEYFRIWIVNLLLILVTLGLYLPWAKVQRLRYFYSNTLIDSEPLHFHGEPVQMFKGLLIFFVISVLFSLLGEFWDEASLVYVLVIAALWPVLFRLSMRFRLSNTSWRGLRFAFGGSMKDAYRACVPLLIPVAFLLALTFFVDQAHFTDFPDQKPTGAEYIGLALTALAGIAVLPWLLCSLKSYQHRNYRFSSETAVFTAKAGNYYFIQLECIGLFIIIFLSIVMFLFPFFLGQNIKEKPIDGFGFCMSLIALFGGLIGFLFIVLSLFLLLPISIVGSIQNLVWGSTHSEHLQFGSTLRLKQAMALTTKNWLLTLLTLGFYRPYAVIAMTRLRLEAVQIESSIDPSQWTATSSTAKSSAIGVGSGDLWGIDVGL